MACEKKFKIEFNKLKVFNLQFSFDLLQHKKIINNKLDSESRISTKSKVYTDVQLRTPSDNKIDFFRDLKKCNKSYTSKIIETLAKTIIINIIDQAVFELKQSVNKNQKQKLKKRKKVSKALELLLISANQSVQSEKLKAEHLKYEIKRKNAIVNHLKSEIDEVKVYAKQNKEGKIQQKIIEIKRNIEQLILGYKTKSIEKESEISKLLSEYQRIQNNSTSILQALDKDRKRKRRNMSCIKIQTDLTFDSVRSAENIFEIEDRYEELLKQQDLLRNQQILHHEKELLRQKAKVEKLNEELRNLSNEALKVNSINEAKKMILNENKKFLFDSIKKNKKLVQKCQYLDLKLYGLCLENCKLKQSIDYYKDRIKTYGIDLTKYILTEKNTLKKSNSSQIDFAPCADTHKKFYSEHSSNVIFSKPVLAKTQMEKRNNCSKRSKWFSITEELLNNSSFPFKNKNLNHSRTTKVLNRKNVSSNLSVITEADIGFQSDDETSSSLTSRRSSFSSENTHDDDDDDSNDDDDVDNDNDDNDGDGDVLSLSFHELPPNSFQEKFIDSASCLISPISSKLSVRPTHRKTAIDQTDKMIDDEGAAAPKINSPFKSYQSIIKTRSNIESEITMTIASTTNAIKAPENLRDATSKFNAQQSVLTDEVLIKTNTEAVDEQSSAHFYFKHKNQDLDTKVFYANVRSVKCSLQNSVTENKLVTEQFKKPKKSPLLNEKNQASKNDDAYFRLVSLNPQNYYHEYYQPFRNEKYDSFYENARSSAVPPAEYKHQIINHGDKYDQAKLRPLHEMYTSPQDYSWPTELIPSAHTWHQEDFSHFNE